MKTLICCIVKQENLYLRDFVEYYKRLGVTNIVLYDNNDLEGEYPHQVIGDYINNGFVIYNDVRGKYRCQLEVYDRCYEKYRNDYDWMGFFDIDEYLEITGNRNIEDFLSQSKFKEADCICVYWLIFGDNGLLHYDSRPVYERFLIPNMPNKEKNCYKLFLRGDKENISVKFQDANAFSWWKRDGKFIVTNSTGVDLTKSNLYTSYCYSDAFLKHYNTLTIEEFLYRRFGRRSYPDKASSFNKEVIMNVFTSINEMTPEKEKIVNDFFNKFEFKEDNV